MTAGSADGQSVLLPVVIVGGVGTGVPLLLQLRRVEGREVCMILWGEEETLLHLVGVDHGFCLPCEPADTTTFLHVHIAGWSTGWKRLPGTSISATPPLNLFAPPPRPPRPPQGPPAHS